MEARQMKLEDLSKKALIELVRKKDERKRI
jgi:hypothetical protein